MKNKYNILNSFFKLFIIIIAILFSKEIIAQSNNGENNPEERLYQEDPEGIRVCGHDAQHLIDRQSKCMDFKSNGSNTDNGLKALNSYPPDGVIDCGKFKLYYEDYGTNYGFYDPILGEDRRNTFCAVLTYIESVVQINSGPASIEIRVEPSATMSDGWLARAGSYFENGFGSVAGVYNGNTFNHITSGIDPDPSFFDCHVEVNFGTIDGEQISYYDDYFTTPLTESYDLYTVLLHEITHTLGFHSMVSDVGSEFNITCANTANSFTNYDWLFGFYGDITNPSSFDNNKLVVGTIDNPIVNTNVNNFEAH